MRARLTLDELKPHMYTLPDQPDVIPYLTSYYKETWGFCLSYNQFLQLKEGLYEVVIDSSLENGSLTYSEYYLRGELPEEILISCYTCHPSLCNDNLSGVVLTTFLAKYLSQYALRHSYRFLFIPETIGAITWLALNEARVKLIRGGLVATCVGNQGSLTYKKSRRGNTEIDRAATHFLKQHSTHHKVIDFFPSGSDERQFCSPGFNLPVGSLMRTPYAQFPQYHTSADNLNFVQPEYLADSFSKYLAIISILENNKKYINLNPKCEPQLGKRGLYQMIGGQKQKEAFTLAMFWVLNFSDGQHTLLDIAERADLDFFLIKAAAEVLLEKQLLKIQA